MKARVVDNKSLLGKYVVPIVRPTSIRAYAHADFKACIAREWSLFTCIPASTTKTFNLNAPKEAVQPFLGSVELGFLFTHNRRAAPTNQTR